MSGREENEDTRCYQFWLDNLKGIGIVKNQALCQHFGTAKKIYQASKEELLSVPALSVRDVENILNSHSTGVEEAWHNFQKRKIKFITREMDQYPRRLRNIYRAPYALYIRGELPQENRISAAIVGARVCSWYGRKMAHEYAKRLSEAGIQIISGLASGIDTSGHLGALEQGGATFGVLGCGVDICYPACNSSVYQRIWSTGGILSEYPPGTAPRAGLFPERNRIISGLSDLVLVMEAREKSGSLITADLALEQGKEVYALPGRVTDDLSRGCNRLIRQGAGILLSPDDLLSELDILPSGNGGIREKEKLSLEKEEWLVYSCVDLQPKNIDEIMKESHCSLEFVLEQLMALQQKGYVTEIFKNYYISN